MLIQKTIFVFVFILLLVSGSLATTNVPDPCVSYATMPGVWNQTVALYSVPNGTGSAFTEAQIFNQGTTVNASITLVVLDASGVPFPHFPAEDMWLESSDGGMVPCVGGSMADSDTGVNGQTSFVSPMRAGGYSMSSCVVMISGMALCQAPFDMYFNSADVNGDGVVNLIDLNLFATALHFNFNFSVDFYCDGVLNLSDLGRFSVAIGGNCQ